MASWSLDIPEDEATEDSQSSFPSAVVVETAAKKPRASSPLTLTPEPSTGTLQRRLQAALAEAPACSDPYMLEAVQPLSKRLDQVMMARQAAAKKMKEAETASTLEAESAGPLVPVEEEHLTIGTPLVELDEQLQARLLSIYLLYMDVPCDDKEVRGVFSQPLAPLAAQEMHAYQDLYWRPDARLRAGDPTREPASGWQGWTRRLFCGLAPTSAF